MKKIPIEFWKSDYGIKIIFGMRLSGLSLKEVSQKVGISIKNLRILALENPEFMKAITIDPVTANMLVEYALFEKAIDGHVSGAVNWLKVKNKEVWKAFEEKSLDDDKNGMTSIIAKAISEVYNENDFENDFDVNIDIKDAG